MFSINHEVRAVTVSQFHLDPVSVFGSALSPVLRDKFSPHVLEVEWKLTGAPCWLRSLSVGSDKDVLAASLHIFQTGVRWEPQKGI